tara:strand:- start:7109 stop:7417 length:309 start_codon:yes stop_codon:yes gene_type:complete
MDRQKNKTRRKIEETQEILEEELDGIAEVNVMLSVMGLNRGNFTSQVTKQMTLKSYDGNGVEDYFLVYEIFVNPKVYKEYSPVRLAQTLLSDFKVKKNMLRL